MSTKHPDLFAALAAPFEPSELKTRSAGAGRQVSYVTARTVMNRLDEVLGPEGWSDDYVPAENSVLCRLTIRLPDGSTLTKADAGGYAGMADSGDDDKSGYSDAFKRAAVKFGVARYLYGDGVPSFARISTPTPTPSPTPTSTSPPPPPATNQARGGWGNTAATNGRAARPSSPADPKVPATGKAFFRWVKDQEERFQVGLLKYLNSWAKLQDFPGRMVDWDTEQVALAHTEACRKLQSLQTSDAYEEALAH